MKTIYKSIALALIYLTLSANALATYTKISEDNPTSKQDESESVYIDDADLSEIGKTGAYKNYKHNVADSLKTKSGLELIGSVTPMYVVVNEEDSVVGYGSSEAEALAVSKIVPKVFKGLKGDSIRETLDKWADSENYLIVWEIENDYTISQNFILYGELLSNNGPLFKILESLEDTGVPIRAVVKSNRAIVIMPSAYK